jgi:mannose/fructose/N-acetylgalactosamine-specific phosphotransferase system component IIC
MYEKIKAKLIHLYEAAVELTAKHPIILGLVIGFILGEVL